MLKKLLTFLSQKLLNKAWIKRDVVLRDTKVDLTSKPPKPDFSGYSNLAEYDFQNYQDWTNLKKCMFATDLETFLNAEHLEELKCLIEVLIEKKNLQADKKKA